MKRVLNVLVVLLIALNLNAQKTYLRSSYPQTNQPVGGFKSVKDLIFKELNYPISALRSNIEGSVIIVFSLSTSGIPQIDRIDGLQNDALIEETKRLLYKIKFKPNPNRPFVASSESFQIDFLKKGWLKLIKKRGYGKIEYPYTPIDSSQKLYSYQLMKEKPYPVFGAKDKYRDFNDYIINKLQYPPEALKINLKGQVVISFVIEQSGNITNIEVVEQLGAGCTSEALRLIKNLKWHPGVKNGKAVRTQMISSIGFGVNSSPFVNAFNQAQGGR